METDVKSIKPYWGLRSMLRKHKESITKVITGNELKQFVILQLIVGYVAMATDLMTHLPPITLILEIQTPY